MFLKSCLLFLCGALTVNAAIPPYIKVCKQSDPNLAQCIINSINEMRPQLRAGIPELNVPSMDPLALNEIKMRSGPNTAKIDANITNLLVFGASSFQISDLRPNIKKARFAFKATIPEMYFTGNYDIDMKLLLLEYKGKGPVSGNFSNYELDCLMKGNKIKKDGEEYLKFDKMKLKMKIGPQAKIILEDLFKEDPVLASAVAAVVQDNTDVFMNEINPILVASLEDKLTDISNQITLKFTYKELFP